MALLPGATARTALYNSGVLFPLADFTPGLTANLVYCWPLAEPVVPSTRLNVVSIN